MLEVTPRHESAQVFRPQEQFCVFASIPIFQNSISRISGVPKGIVNMPVVYYPGFMMTLTLKVPDVLVGRIEQEARRRGASKSAVIRDCLERVLLNGGKCGGASFHDLARHLCGIGKGGPRDLASNPKHLEGLGR